MTKTTKHLSEENQSVSQESNKKHYSLPFSNQGKLKGLPGLMSFEGFWHTTDHTRQSQWKMRKCNKISVNINSTNIIILQTHLYTLQQKQPHRQMNKYDKSVWEFVVTIMSVTSAFLTRYELFAVLILSFIMYGYVFFLYKIY